jgi:hypothetical protein
MPTHIYNIIYLVRKYNVPLSLFGFRNYRIGEIQSDTTINKPLENKYLSTVVRTCFFKTQTSIVRRDTKIT